MKKKLMSLFLTIAVALSLWIPAYAIEQNPLVDINTSDSYQNEDILSDISDSLDISYTDQLKAAGKTVVDEHPYIPYDEQLELEGQKDATVVEYSDGTEEIIYKIPIYEQDLPATRTAVAYINVSITGNGSGKLTAKLWRVGSIKSCNLTMKIMYGTCRVETPNNEKTSRSVTSIGTAASPTTLTANISTTKYFVVKVIGSFDGMSVNYKTYNILFNKKAARYPEYTCPVSKIYCVPPYYSDFPAGPSINWSGRKAYIKWFNNKYNNGSDPWNWNNYQIHHIRPRQYGGTNEYSNLIPLKESTHKIYNKWWLSY